MRSGVIDFISAIVSSGSSTLVCSSRRCPCRRSVGGLPTARCKSRRLAADDGFEQTIDLNRDAIVRSVSVASCDQSVIPIVADTDWMHRALDHLIR